MSPQKIKPQTPKQGRNKRKVNHTCPNCLSNIYLNERGVWECKGNRLEFWKNETRKYQIMNEQERNQYLDTLQNKDQFLDWLEKGDVLCGWTSDEKKHEPEYRITIPDPIIVGKIEKDLGRELTENELYEETVFYTDESRTKFSSEEVEGWEAFTIPRIEYPDDC